MDHNENIGYLIHMIDNRIKADIDAQFKKHNLTFSQSQVLHLLEKHGGSISQKQLQELMNVSHPTMVGLVSRLEDNHFVETKYDESDRRNKIVSMTKEVAELRKDFLAGREKHQTKMLKGISDEELDEVKDILHRILDNIA